MRSEDSDTRGECCIWGRQLLAKFESQMQTAWLFCSLKGRLCSESDRTISMATDCLVSEEQKWKLRVPTLYLCDAYHTASPTVSSPREGLTSHQTSFSVQRMPVFSHIGRMSALFLPCKLFGGLNGAVTKYFVNRSCWTFGGVTQG